MYNEYDCDDSLLSPFYNDVGRWDVLTQSNPIVEKVSPNGTCFVFVKFWTKQGVLFCQPRCLTKQNFQSLESCWVFQWVILCFVFVFVVCNSWPNVRRWSTSKLNKNLYTEKGTLLACIFASLFQCRALVWEYSLRKMSCTFNTKHYLVDKIIKR